MTMADFYSLGLVGYPLEHSHSPKLHMAALDALKLRGEYRLYPVEPLPGGEKALRETLNQVRNGELQGLNVTIPHKKSVVDLLDKLSPIAQEVGAVNTIYQSGDHLIGDNTDVPGFLADLERITSKLTPGGLLDSTETVQNSLILGAGGSARAVVYGLKQKGWSVTIAARRVEQAQKLLADLPDRPSMGSEHVIHLELNSIKEIGDVYSLIVNTTPVGMWPDVGTSPWPENLAIPSGAFVYDLVYNPTETIFVRTAREEGNYASGGMGMLVEQAALAFERWTGLLAPRPQMNEAVALMHPSSQARNGK
jgi:shikimate dehydrogenase